MLHPLFFKFCDVKILFTDISSDVIVNGKNEKKYIKAIFWYYQNNCIVELVPCAWYTKWSPTCMYSKKPGYIYIYIVYMQLPFPYNIVQYHHKKEATNYSPPLLYHPSFCMRKGGNHVAKKCLADSKHNIQFN